MAAPIGFIGRSGHSLASEVGYQRQLGRALYDLSYDALEIIENGLGSRRMKAVGNS
jgi:hypothetical protein